VSPRHCNKVALPLSLIPPRDGTNKDIVDTLHLRDVAMATTFWLSMGYNFGCMIASDMLFDSGGGFSGSSCPMKTQPI